METKQRHALILYATMTRNTEKIAEVFEQTFRHYNWDVTRFKMTLKPADWEGMQEKLYFDDYDIVCLGSPIVAGYPITVVNKVFSLGAGGALEKEIQDNLDKGETRFDEKMEATSMKNQSAIAKSGKPAARRPAAQAPHRRPLRREMPPSPRHRRSGGLPPQGNRIHHLRRRILRFR